MNAGTATNARVGQPDWWLLSIALILVCMGLTMVFSASGIVAAARHADKYYFFKRQLIFAAGGGLALTIAAAAPRALLYSLQYPLLFGVMGLLALTVTPLGISANGAHRWIGLGFFRLQPMELAKIALVLYLAFFMSTKQAVVKTFSRGVIPPFAITGALCLLLLLQPDFGGAAVLSMLLFFMCLVGGTRIIYLILSAGLALGGAAMLVIMEPYRFQRLTAYMDPFKDPSGSGYQLIQSLYAMGTGGWFGLGLGASRRKLFYLPEAHNDFIMAIMAEETGFIGISLVFILMALLVWRGLRIALKQEDLRARFTAFGLTMVLAISMLLNMAVITGSVPPKGVPMPFFSYGGSSLFCTMLCVGLLLNFSRTMQRTNRG